MAKVKVEDLRNVVVCGHGSSGKTTLVDRFLTDTETVKANPSVDEGTSICDFDPVEKAHKYTIEPSLVHFDFGNKHFQVFDTPGYPDFIGQTIGTMAGTENAAIVVNAHAGIEVNTRRVFKLAGNFGLGRFVVINKMDDENVDFAALVESIREVWGPQCLPLNVPVGIGNDFKGVISTLKAEAGSSGAVVDPAEYSEPLLESIIEVDEAVMERYFEGQPPTDDELEKLLVKAVLAGTVVPILCCASSTGVGVRELLETIARYGVSPADKAVTATNETGEAVTLSPDPSGPLAAQVIRTRIDPFVQKLSFIRVHSGTLKKDEHVATSSTRKGLKMGALLNVQADQTTAVDEAGPGEIVAVAKMDDLHTGTSIGELKFSDIPFPVPMVGLAVSPKTRGDETKLSGALHKVVEEDPTLRLERDPQTKELVMTGLSELHLNIIQEKLKSRDKLEIETKDPKIPFRETIQTPAEGSYRHKKQSGGRGQFGEVHIRMFPFPRGTKPEEYVTKDRFPHLKEYHYDDAHNFLWVDTVVGGVIPGNFMPAIEKGFRERLENGVIAGYMVQDVGVEVHFGKHHPVDSSETAFKSAAKQVFRRVFEQAKPSLPEPLVKMEITVPDDHVGDVYSDMSSRGGRVSGSDPAGGGMTVVHAEVPLREVSHYARTLSSMTGGQGSYSMEFSHYEVMPSNVQQEIASSASIEDEDED